MSPAATLEPVERDALLARLAEHLDAAACGAGRLVLLRGAAGTGKTVVLEEFARRARRVATVHAGACDPVAAPRPLGPLGDVAPGLGAAVEDAVGRARAGRAGPADVLDARERDLRRGGPTVLVDEDVQWADPATRDLLCLAARRIGRENALLVASYRDDEVGPAHPLRALLGELALCPAAHREEVVPWSAAAVAALASGRGVDGAQVLRLTGGNPRLVTEVLATGTDRVPPTVVDAVGGRLSRVSPEGRALAVAVAVLGSHAPGPLVAALADDTAAAEELLDDGLLVSVDDGLGFSCELARRAVLEATPGFHRARASARVLARLRGDPGWCDDVDLLARHADAAGDAHAVLAYAPAAAARATASGRDDDALAHRRLALRHGAVLTASRRAALWEQLARTGAATAGPAEALDALDAARELHERAGDHVREGDVRHRSALLLWLSGRGGDARDAAVAAARVLERTPAADGSPELARAALTLARLCTYDQDGPATVADHAERAVATARRAGDDGVVPRARFHAATAAYLDAADERVAADRWADMVALRGEALDARASGAGASGAGAEMAAVTAACAAVRREHERTDAALDLLAARPPTVPAHLAAGARALSLVDRGAWEEADAHVRALLGRAGVPPVARAAALVAQGRLRARRGDPGAWSALDEAAGIVEPAGWTLLIHAARAEAAWLDGDDARARAEARRGLDRVTAHTDTWVSGELARWAVLAGDEPPAVRAAGPFAHELAGDWRAAARAWEQRGCPYDAALARLRGDEPALRAAAEAFASIGARPAEQVARARLRDRGVRHGTRGPRAGTRADTHGLTGRQVEILALVGDGLTDPQIARRLHISTKTASNHVSAILAKLGVESRCQAAAANLGRSSP